MIVNIICPLFIFLALYLSLFFSFSSYLLFLLLNFFFSTNLFILFINSCHSSVLFVFLTFSLFNFLLYFKILFVDQFSNSIVSPYIFFCFFFPPVVLPLVEGLTHPFFLLFWHSWFFFRMFSHCILRNLLSNCSSLLQRSIRHFCVPLGCI